MGDSFMKIERIPETTIEEFARKHGLTLHVRERRTTVNSQMRFFASFENADVKDGSMLRGEFGNGNTPDGAARDYAERISLKRLAINAMQENRREVDVPRLVHLPESADDR